MAGVEMKLRRPYPLLAAIAVVSGIAAYVGTAETTAPPSDRAINSGGAAPARTAARSPDPAVESRPPAGNPLWALPLKQPSITLVGTILGTSESIGIFLNPATRDIVRLRLGEDHEGWALRSVKTREVTLVKDRERVVLELPPPGDQASATDFTPPDLSRPPPPNRRQQRH